METVWSTVDDDALMRVDQAVAFLQGEFCPPAADPIWSADFFRRKLGPANPAGGGYMSLAMVDERVVGTLSLTRKRILLDGVQHIGAEIGDSYSSQDVRRNSRPRELSPFDPNPDSYVNKSVFGRLVSVARARAEADGISLIYGTPNENSYPGYTKRLDFFDLRDHLNQSYTRPTARWFMRRYPLLHRVGSVVRGIEHISLGMQNFCSGLGRHFSIDTQIPTEAELDVLWEGLKPVSGFSLVRDGAYWHHRYVAHPLAHYAFHAIRERSKLAGLVVTRCSTLGDGSRAVCLAEWMNDEHVGFGQMLTVIADHYKNHAVDKFNFWAEKTSAEARIARWNLFSSRHRIPIIFADTPQARTVRGGAANMKFYLGSSDAV